LRGRSLLNYSGRYRPISMGLFAVVCILIGILIASNLDFSKQSVADVKNRGNYDGSVVLNDDGQYTSPFVGVIEKVTGAVVNVVAEQKVATNYSDDFFWRFFRAPRGAEAQISTGSGFFFRDDGYILTNYHVVRDAEKIEVRTASGYRYDAELVGLDDKTDLAVIKVKPEEEITYIPFGNSAKIRVGDWAIAIGNPFPQQGLDRTVTVGVISAKGRSNLNFGEGTPKYQSYIQTDASINPGNSGGPLVNLQGEAIGVNAAISSPTGASVGIGFAIPINMARAIVPDLIATGHVERGILGINLTDVTERQAREEGLSAVKGVYVHSVLADSPADKAGIHEGDILTSFNGEEITDADNLSYLISTAPLNKKSEIDLVRDGKRMSTEATIVNEDDFRLAHSAEFDNPNQGISWLGMDLLTFTDDIAKQIGEDYIPGVFINRVRRGSPAYRAGIAPGSIITQVDNKEIKNLVELQVIAEGMEGRQKAIPFLLVDPRGSIEYKAIKP
jgi:serine protease Do